MPEQYGEPWALPLDAVKERVDQDQGWQVRMRVHAEHVTVSKEIVVREQVAVRRGLVHDVRSIEAVVQREQLEVETLGEAEIDDSPTVSHTLDTDTSAAQHHVRQRADRLAARQGVSWRKETPADDEHSRRSGPPQP